MKLHYLKRINDSKTLCGIYKLKFVDNKNEGITLHIPLVTCEKCKERM